MAREIEINARMRKRVRESRYGQDRRSACLICRNDFSVCAHSWADVAEMCRIVKEYEGRTTKFKLVP